MKNKFLLLFFPLLILLVNNACKKDSSTPKTNISDVFPNNTLWVGTFQPISRQYNKPVCLKFNTDNTVTMYGLFYFKINDGYVQKDSIGGKINTTNSTTAATSLSFELTELKETVDITISSDKKTITGGILNAVSLNYFMLNLELFPDKDYSINGTSWSGAVMHGGPVEGLLAYPDLSTISFTIENNVKNTYYNRYGNLAKITVPQSGDSYVVKSVYQQQGPIVMMNGFNESSSKLVYYFGVVMPSKDKILADSRSYESRLPNYLQTIEWYGPRGMTPVIYKK